MHNFYDISIQKIWVGVILIAEYLLNAKKVAMHMLILRNVYFYVPSDFVQINNQKLQNSKSWFYKKKKSNDENNFSIYFCVLDYWKKIANKYDKSSWLLKKNPKARKWKGVIPIKISPLQDKKWQQK